MKNRRLGEIYDQVKTGDVDHLDLLEDLIMIRALTVDYLNRCEELSEGLRLWHASFKGTVLRKLETEAQLVVQEWLDARPKRVMDLTKASELLKQATGVVETIERIRHRGSISMESHIRVVEEMALAVTKEFSEAKYIPSLRRIEKSWRNIVVDNRIKPKPHQLSDEPTNEGEKVH